MGNIKYLAQIFHGSRPGLTFRQALQNKHKEWTFIYAYFSSWVIAFGLGHSLRLRSVCYSCRAEGYRTEGCGSPSCGCRQLWQYYGAGLSIVDGQGWPHTPLRENTGPKAPSRQNGLPKSFSFADYPKPAYGLQVQRLHLHLWRNSCFVFD